MPCMVYFSPLFFCFFLMGIIVGQGLEGRMCDTDTCWAGLIERGGNGRL